MTFMSFNSRCISKFGEDNSITFNEKKSVCMRFGANNHTLDILLNGKLLNGRTMSNTLAMC